jgi:hypothetical protein
MFRDSMNLKVLLHSMPVLRILDAISKFKAGKRFMRGPVDQDILCAAEDVHAIQITQQLPTLLRMKTEH